MNEGEIRMQAQMYAIVAEMNGLIAGIEGMKAANAERQANGDALAYGEKEFVDVEKQLCAIAEKLRKEI